MSYCFQVFIGAVRPTTETFINETTMESYKMEYRTRHSIDGEIIQCEQRIALVTGYMTQEVHGVNAMNFIHRDEVRWVIVALRESKCLKYLPFVTVGWRVTDTVAMFVTYRIGV